MSGDLKRKEFLFSADGRVGKKKPGREKRELKTHAGERGTSFWVLTLGCAVGATEGQAGEK